MKLNFISNNIPSNFPELTIAAKKSVAYTFGGFCKTLSLAGGILGVVEGYQAWAGFNHLPISEMKNLRNKAALLSICFTLSSAFLDRQSRDAFAYANDLSTKKVEQLKTE